MRSKTRKVIVRKAVKKLSAKPTNEWPPDFLACLGAWKEDIPRPRARKIAKKKHPFSHRRIKIGSSLA
jgi:hypothetical protein